MTILGIDTSSATYTSIGFYFSNEEMMEINLKAPLSQEEKLFFAIDSGLKILKKDIKDVDVFAVGIGPGSFTGLRIGIAAVKSMAWSLSKKIIPLSSLDLLTDSAGIKVADKNVISIPMTDARMNKVFTAIYRNGGKISEDMDIEPAKLRNMIMKFDEENIMILGDGIQRHGSIFQNIPGKIIHFMPDAFIRGNIICRQALEKAAKDPLIISDVKDISPVYLRMSEAEAQRDKK